MTGLDLETDALVEVAALVTDGELNVLGDGVDIIIATPGRLLDYYKQHVFSLNAVEIMVIDEAREIE